jgi:hypothetical protein
VSAVFTQGSGNVDTITPAFNPANVRSIFFIESFSYELIEDVKINMKTFNYNLIQVPNGANAVSVKGQILLDQKEPFALGAMKREIGYEGTNNLYNKLQDMQMIYFIDELKH